MSTTRWGLGQVGPHSLSPYLLPPDLYSSFYASTSPKMDPDHGLDAAEPDANAEESNIRALLQSASTITFDGLLSADADLKCHACSASESPGGEIKLRRCSACSIALYCSEKCQKKAWSGHKYVHLSTSLPSADSNLLPIGGYSPFPTGFTAA